MTKQRKSAPTKNRDRRSAAGETKRGAKPAKLRQEPVPAMLPARPSKKAAILGLLQRSHGAAIGELTEATGWQVHSVRAALTGLRKDGKELTRTKDDAGVTRYRLGATG